MDAENPAKSEMKTRIQLKGSQQEHFWLLIGLAVFFYLAYVALEILDASGVLTKSIEQAKSISQWACIQLLGVALGVFRGMLPDNQNSQLQKPSA